MSTGLIQIPREIGRYQSFGAPGNERDYEESDTVDMNVHPTRPIRVSTM